MSWINQPATEEQKNLFRRRRRSYMKEFYVRMTGTCSWEGTVKAESMKDAEDIARNNVDLTDADWNWESVDEIQQVSEGEE